MINQSELIILHQDSNILDNFRYAGKVTAKCLNTIKDLISNKTPNLSLKDIEKTCHNIISISDCTPTFLNYKGFPGSICTSVNNNVVHGIPSSYKLQSGDVIKIDVGVTYKDGIGDAAITCIYGEPKDNRYLNLVETCHKALYKGIEAIKIGKKIGEIGYAIYNYIKKKNYKLITQYGGHGIANGLHSPPFISNRSDKDEGIRVQPGLLITIEPMLTMGLSNKTFKKTDNWAVYTKGISAHFEHSILVNQDNIEILTEI